MRSEATRHRYETNSKKRQSREQARQEETRGEKRRGEERRGEERRGDGRRPEEGRTGHTNGSRYPHTHSPPRRHPSATAPAPVSQPPSTSPPPTPPSTHPTQTHGEQNPGARRRAVAPSNRVGAVVHVLSGVDATLPASVVGPRDVVLVGPADRVVAHRGRVPDPVLEAEQELGVSDLELVLDLAVSSSLGRARERRDGQRRDERDEAEHERQGRGRAGHRSRIEGGLELVATLCSRPLTSSLPLGTLLPPQTR